MKQYLDLLDRIVKEGVWVENKRTKSKCLTIINHDLMLTPYQFPLVTTRKSYYKVAIGEILGYIRGYTKTSQFHELGVKTWDANAQNPDWLDNPNHKFMNEKYGDLGLIYGAVGNQIHKVKVKNKKLALSDELVSGHTLKDIVDNLTNDNDTRGLIWNFWNPMYFELGCLRPCMFMHQFSLLGDTVHLNTTQRSQDVPLGGNFNMIQAWFLLWLVCQLSGKKQGNVYHKIVNAHIYENQLDQVKEQLSRTPFDPPTFKYVGKEKITWDYVLNRMHPNDFVVENYQYHPPIKFEFTV